MAWTHAKPRGDMLVASETAITLPGSAIAGYSSVISWLTPNPKEFLNQYVMFGFHPSAISEGDIDFALYGAMTATGTKVLLKDTVVADQTTGAGALVFGAVDINAYPFPYYFMTFTAAGDESANTISCYVVSGK